MRLGLDAVIMVPWHVTEFAEVAARRDEVIIFRSVNPDATRLIEAHFATRGMSMSVKGKSADWGPQAGMAPLDQKFSKLGSPGKRVDWGNMNNPEYREIVKFQEKVTECLEKNICAKMDGVTPNGENILVRLTDTGDEVPLLFDGERYIDYRSRAPVTLSEAEIDALKPMEVLAVKDADGKLVPLTADYDFLAVGDRGDVVKPGWDPVQGAVTPAMRETIDDINRAARHRARHPDGRTYQGGNIVHHGPETWYPGSPGALRNDPEITILDPARKASAAARRAGRWSVDRGSYEMIIEVDGNTFTGRYGKNLEKSIEGTIDGDTLTGWWREEKRYGRFQNYLDAGGNHWRGKWNMMKDEVGKWNGGWSAVRIPD